MVERQELPKFTLKS